MEKGYCLTLGWMKVYYMGHVSLAKIKLKISELGKLDYIYISHIHEDHCSITIKH